MTSVLIAWLFLSLVCALVTQSWLFAQERYRDWVAERERRRQQEADERRYETGVFR
jgi:hypothetical protein